MEYKVIRPFYDKQDHDKLYSEGDIYNGKKGAKRISELTNPDKNEFNQVYIEKIKPDESIAKDL
ncbi:hypothetical protein [Enterococcus sp. DIV1420a]|uniref:hypothetical protein n=1 Tax=Enterococcus TaxID=1350 RepID=UPI003F1E67FE